MKKMLIKLSVLMALVLVIVSCFSCAKPKEKNAVGKLIDEGYECTSSASSAGHWKGIFEKEENGKTIYYLGKVKMNAEEEKAFYEGTEGGWDFDSQSELLSYAQDATIEDVTDQMPTQAELDQYIGKTLGDLENEGYENTGNSNSEGIYTFYYDGPKYNLLIGLTEGIIIEDMDDYSHNDLKALTIGSVQLIGYNLNFDDVE